MSPVAKLPEKAGKRERTKAANRTAILAAAKRVFARIGVEATTVRDIIRETDLAAGTFYNYFKSKEEVFQAIAEESTKRFRPRLKTVRENATTFEEYVRVAYGEFFHWLREENEEAVVDGAPHHALVGVRVDTPEMHAIFDEIRNDLVTAAQAANVSIPDPEYFTAAAIGIAREVGDHMLQRRPVDADKAADFATQLVLRGGLALIEKK